MSSLCCCWKAKEKEEEDDKNLPPPCHLPPVVRRATSTSVGTEKTKLPPGVILTGGAKLQAKKWKGTGIKVAVIDSGVDREHPEFHGKVTRQVWLRSGTPLTEDDHGTHVAGTIHMMAPEAEIYDYRVFGRDGELSVDGAIAESIRAATDASCQVINMSLGGPAPNPAIREACKYAASKNVVIVCAAGNEGDGDPLTNEVSYPASHSECISVAAVSKQEGLPVARFSNSNVEVDYAGIGVDVHSFQPGGGYQIMSGTSMASPHVAGLVACLLSGKKKAKDIRKALDKLALDIATEGKDTATGVGFVTYLSKSDFDKQLPTLTAAVVE